MTAVVLITVIGGAGVAFLIRFFVALCKETKGRTCHAVHRLPPSTALWNIEVEELPSIGVSHAIPRNREPEPSPEGTCRKDQQLPGEPRYSWGR